MSLNIDVPVPSEKQRRLDTETNALLQVLINSTPTQVNAYLASNVTTVVQTQKVLAALALAVRYLYHRGK